MEPAEFTFIGIDNSEVVSWDNPFYHAQRKAIIFYCENLLKCNPDNAVCLILMSSWKIWLGPTRDLQEILCRLEHVPWFGKTNLGRTFEIASKVFSLVPTHMKRRLLVFIASRLHELEDSCFIHPVPCGRALKEISVGLHVFNFCLSGLNTLRLRYLNDYLERLVTAVNHNDNSGLEVVHVSDDICCKLSNSILRENLDYLSKTTRDEMSRAARDIEISDLSHIVEKFGPDNRVVSSPIVRILALQNKEKKREEP